MNIGPIIRAMRHNRTRVLLLVLEIAMALAIVTNCVNVILAERARMSQQSGFDDAHLIKLTVQPFASEFRDDRFVLSTIDRDLRTIESVPGVRAAANTSLDLWRGGGSSTQFFALGEQRPAVITQIYFGSAHLMQALGAEIVEGRSFEDGDHATGSQPDHPTHAIITKTMADLLFPDGHAVGRTIQQGEPGRTYEDPVTVIGVVREFYNPFGRATSLASYSDRAVFLPSRVGDFDGMVYLIRTDPVAQSPVIESIDAQLTGENGGRVLQFKTIAEQRSRWFASNHIVVTTMSCIIVALVVVTALGLLGLTSLSVTERTRQIGTRRALGATRADIMLHLLVENWLVTTAGLVLGVVGAYGLNVLLVSQVSDAKLQWELVAAGVLLLWVNALIATVPPALRAMTIPPSLATRAV